MARIERGDSSALILEGAGGFDKRVIVGLSVVGAVPYTALLVGGAPLPTLALVPMATALLAGALTDNFGGEWMDGGATAVCTLLTCYVATLAALWVQTMGMASVPRTNFLVFSATALAALINLIFIPFFGAIGAVAGNVGARFNVNN